MSVTQKTNLVIPEVVAALVETNLGDNITLLPLAEQDDTLVGQPGDTLTFPVFAYIGKASVVGENGQIVPVLLEESTTAATVHKYGKAVQLTDEARLSAYGDPVGEIARQLARAIDHAIDDELFSVLAAAAVSRKYVSSSISADILAGALALFGEDLDGVKVFITDAAGFAALRQDDDYVGRGDMGETALMKGTVGEVWGCQIVVSSKIVNSAAQAEKNYFIVKPGALRLVNKRGTVIETEREPDYQRDTIYATKHCVAYLYDASRVVCLTQFTALQTVTSLAADAGFETVAGTDSGEYRIVIPALWAAPSGYKWVYKHNTATTEEGTFGSAYSGTDWTEDADVTASTNTYVHLLLVNSADTKPVKTLTLAINKKA